MSNLPSNDGKSQNAKPNRPDRKPEDEQDAVKAIRAASASAGTGIAGVVAISVGVVQEGTPVGVASDAIGAICLLTAAGLAVAAYVWKNR